MKNIALLRASHSKTSARNFQREMPTAVKIINMHSQKFKQSEYDPDTYDGIIISGSSSSVLDDDDWISKAQEFVTKSVDEHEIPTLGVCWGNQLIAHTFGGIVEQRERRELGFREVEQIENKHPIFRGINDNFTAFQSHTDYVSKIPSEGTLLAENDVAKQSFSYKSAVGVQFHPEIDYRTARDLTDKYKQGRTVPKNPDTDIESWALSKESSDILKNFLHRIV